MLVVNDLVKRYGDLVALDGVSFQVEPGQAVGFLGPNGAGKTTTMRIITCFLPPTSGSVTVSGFDIATRSMEVRRHIGYLPEGTPLYPDFRVGEFLRLRASLKLVCSRAERRQAVGRAMERVSIADVEHRPIGQLSKGYRQRVGLADALLGKPDLLILDEPTVGLDPNQVREMRGLIKEIAKEQTILLSTHTLSEVEATCGRVIIIHRGKIVAEGDVASLSRDLAKEARIVLEAKAPESAASALTKELGVFAADEGTTGDGWRRITLAFPASQDGRDRIAAACQSHGWPIRELAPVRFTLEDAFARLTAGNPEEAQAMLQAGREAATGELVGQAAGQGKE